MKIRVCNRNPDFSLRPRAQNDDSRETPFRTPSYRLDDPPPLAGVGFFYVQDERYFAGEHMDVRREACQNRTAYQCVTPFVPHRPGTSRVSTWRR